MDDVPVKGEKVDFSEVQTHKRRFVLPSDEQHPDVAARARQLEGFYRRQESGEHVSPKFHNFD